MMVEPQTKQQWPWVHWVRVLVEYVLSGVLFLPSVSLLLITLRPRKPCLASITTLLLYAGHLCMPLSPSTITLQVVLFALNLPPFFITLTVLGGLSKFTGLWSCCWIQRYKSTRIAYQRPIGCPAKAVFSVVPRPEITSLPVISHCHHLHFFSSLSTSFCRPQLSFLAFQPFYLDLFLPSPQYLSACVVPLTLSLIVSLYALMLPVPL